MPLPALHRRFVPGIDGNGRNQLCLKVALTAQPLAALPPYGCGVPFTGLSAYGSCIFLRASADRAMPQVCHCEEAAGRRGALSAQRGSALGCNLAGLVDNRATLAIRLVRDRVGREAPRNDNSEVHTILTMVCTDRQHCAGSGMPLPYNGVNGRREYPEICSCQWRSLTAATDAIGAYHFNDGLYGLQVPSRDCHGREAPSQ